MKGVEYLEELGLTPEQVKYVMEHPCLYEQGVPEDELTCKRYREMGRRGCAGCTCLNGLIWVKTRPDGFPKMIREIREILREKCVAVYLVVE